MSSEAFLLSWARDREPAAAVSGALAAASLEPARIQDAVFGLPVASSVPDPAALAGLAGLTCPASAVTPGLRALSFAAASLLCDDAALAAVIGLEGEACPALLLASAEAVGRLNLLPSIRLVSRALGAPERALQLAGLGAADVDVRREGESLLSLVSLLDELEAQTARWGMISSAGLTVLMERL